MKEGANLILQHTLHRRPHFAPEWGQGTVAPPDRAIAPSSWAVSLVDLATPVGVASHRCWKPILNKFTSTAGRKIVSRHPTQKLEISNSHEMGPQGTDLSLDP